MFCFVVVSTVCVSRAFARVLCRPESPFSLGNQRAPSRLRRPQGRWRRQQSPANLSLSPGVVCLECSVWCEGRAFRRAKFLPPGNLRSVTRATPSPGVAQVSEERILFANVVSCPEGLRALAEHAPGVRVLPLDPREEDDF